MAFEAWLLFFCSEYCRRTLSQKEQLQRLAVSLRQYGFLVLHFCSTLYSQQLRTSICHLTSRYDDIRWNKWQMFTLMLFRFSSSAKFKMLDCMSNFQCHCCSKLYRKQNFQMLKPNVNYVTFAAAGVLLVCFFHLCAVFLTNKVTYNVNCVVPPAGYIGLPQKWGVRRTPHTLRCHRPCFGHWACSKERLFIRDLLFIERFTFSGDDVASLYAQTFVAEFLKLAVSNDYLFALYTRVYNRTEANREKCPKQTRILSAVWGLLRSALLQCSLVMLLYGLRQ